MTSKRQFINSRATWVFVAFVVLVVICANAFLAVKTTKDLARVQKSLTNTGSILLELDDLHLLVLSAENSQRGFLLTQVEADLAPFTRALSDLSEQIENIQAVKTEIVNQQHHIDELVSLIREKMAELQETVILALDGDAKQAIGLVKRGQGRTLSLQIQRVFKQAINNELSHREMLYKNLHAVEQESTITFIISAFTSAFLLLGMIALARVNLNSQQALQNSLQKQNEDLALKVDERTKELSLYSEELARSNRELEAFAFVASHDLQEPLRKIRAFGDRINRAYADELGEQGADYLNRMKNAAERMSTLISDLLAFSRVTTRGKDFVDVDLVDIVSGILSDLEIAIAESGADIKVDQLPTIQADPSQMHQLFVNLISNAIKFRHTGQSPKIQISYSTEEVIDDITNQASTWNIFTLSDNGIGFEQEFADKIFVPFQRLHARSEYKGTGIGLAVCRRIVERHGGTILAQSELGKGTIFTIKMPQDPSLNKITE